MKKEKPIVGQVLYSLNVGNASRSVEQELTPVIVKKVGRKYFYVNKKGYSDYYEIQYYIDSWKEKTETCQNHILYLDKKTYEDEKETEKICSFIASSFSYGSNNKKLSLGALREIEAIIKKGK